MTDLAVEELRSRYDREWDRTQRLEDKAKNIISTAGTFTSLVFGFVTLSTSVFKFAFPLHLAFTIAASVITSILAILISILALRLQTYIVTFDPTKLETIRDKLQRVQDKQLVKGVIASYIDCIISNYGLNNRKAKKVNHATNLLFISIVLIGIATGITLSLFQGRPAGPTLTIPDGASIQGHSSYQPNPITVLRGDTIVIENKDSFIHTITSDRGPNDQNIGMLFDTGIIKPGESAEVVVANLPPNEYPFFCTVHPYMKGILKVIVSTSATASQRFEGSPIIGIHENISKPIH